MLKALGITPLAYNAASEDVRSEIEVVIAVLEHQRRLSGLQGWCHNIPIRFNDLPIHHKIDPKVIAASGIDRSPSQIAAR